MSNRLNNRPSIKINLCVVQADSGCVCLPQVPREKRTISQPKADIQGSDVDPNKRWRVLVQSCGYVWPFCCFCCCVMSAFFFSRNIMTSLPEASMASADSRIQVLKGVPLNIVLPGNQLVHDKRALFPSPDTTVTVSIAAMPSYPVKTEEPSHAFSVTVPNPHCSEPEGHAVTFERQLGHSQFSPNTQPRTPDSTFPETFKDGGQEVGWCFYYSIRHLLFPSFITFLLVLLFSQLAPLPQSSYNITFTTHSRAWQCTACNDIWT